MIFPEPTPPIIESEEFLLRINDPERKGRAKLILGAYDFVFNYFHSSFPEHEKVELRLRDSPSPNGEANSMAIYLTTGAIEHCLDAKYVDPVEILPPNVAPLVTRKLVSFAAATWILGHEWAHVIRKHEDLKAACSDVPFIGQAVEWDADLMAVAMVYRCLQADYHGTLSDNDIRKLALFLIFWAIRTLPRTSNHDIHLPIEVRFYHFLAKLGDLGRDLKKPEDQAQSVELLQLLLACEKALIDEIDDSYEEYHLGRRWKVMLEDKDYLNVVNAWDSVTHLVEELTGSIAVRKD